MPKMFSPSTMFLKTLFCRWKHEKPASKVAELAQIQPKSQFLFQKKSPTALLLYNDFDQEGGTASLTLWCFCNGVVVFWARSKKKKKMPSKLGHNKPAKLSVKRLAMQYLKIPLTLFQDKDSFYHHISVSHGKE